MQPTHFCPPHRQYVTIKNNVIKILWNRLNNILCGRELQWPSSKNNKSHGRSCEQESNNCTRCVEGLLTRMCRSHRPSRSSGPGGGRASSRPFGRLVKPLELLTYCGLWEIDPECAVCLLATHIASRQPHFCGPVQAHVLLVLHWCGRNKVLVAMLGSNNTIK
jgi:hypothetical protein